MKTDLLVKSLHYLTRELLSFEALNFLSDYFVLEMPINKLKSSSIFPCTNQFVRSDMPDYKPIFLTSFSSTTHTVSVLVSP